MKTDIEFKKIDKLLTSPLSRKLFVLLTLSLLGQSCSSANLTVKSKGEPVGENEAINPPPNPNAQDQVVAAPPKIEAPAAEPPASKEMPQSAPELPPEVTEILPPELETGGSASGKPMPTPAEPGGDLGLGSMPVDAQGPISTKSPYTLFIGSGASKIGLVKFDPQTGAMSNLRSVSLPSGVSSGFLAFRPFSANFYAANESSNGGVVAFSYDIKKDSITLLNSHQENEKGPAHLTVSGSGQWLVTANFDSGSIASYQILEDGSLSARKSKLYVCKNAHQIIQHPNRSTYFVSCMGDDKIVRVRLNESSGAFSVDGSHSLEPGSGPRHVAVHPVFEFLISLQQTANTFQSWAFQPNGGETLLVKRGDPLSTFESPPAFDSTAGEIQLHPNGKYVYGSNRSANQSSIAIRAVSANGTLGLIKTIPSGGAHPRHFSLDKDGRWMFVANMDSNNLVTFAITQQGGQIVPTGSPLSFEKPKFIGGF